MCLWLSNTLISKTVRRPEYVVLHFRSPLKSADGDHPTKANRVGESFRNRIAINGGPWKVGTRPTNAESECESRSRKWNFVSPCANRDKPALTFIAINYRRQTGGETGTLCTKRDLRFMSFAALWYINRCKERTVNLKDSRLIIKCQNPQNSVSDTKI